MPIPDIPIPHPLRGRRCDVFCNIVDNYGDIGVAWRLARQLAREHGLKVRLWVDDLASFCKLRPEAHTGLLVQIVQGVEVQHWVKPFPETEPAEIVIETFACDLPENYLEAMAARDPKPLWINLDHLSAEDWVTGCHGLPSPHPRLPLTAHFFFPGFSEGTGGLLREAGILTERDAFQSSREAIQHFWRSLDMPVPESGVKRVSLFAYDNPGIPELLGTWAAGHDKIVCIVPEGLPVKRVAAYFGQTDRAPGTTLSRGNLEVHIVPFLDQDDYDRLLWACDFNFVRGEDSFVRAQWATRSFIWQIYIQQDDAHWAKLEAFLDLFCAGLDTETAAAYRSFTHAWNRGNGLSAAWPRIEPHLDSLQRYARAWADGLSKQDDLATNLMLFCQEKL